MGMTNENKIEQLEYAILLIKQNGKDYLDERDIPILETAIDTMRKYQKIEQIVKVWHQDIYAKDFECMSEVADIFEEGEPSVTPQPCDDAVSRAEAQTKIEIMRKYQQLEDFARWVAVEVIDEELWTYNHLSFAEIACRKLVQLGIMQESDGEYKYEVVEDGKID